MESLLCTGSGDQLICNTAPIEDPLFYVRPPEPVQLAPEREHSDIVAYTTIIDNLTTRNKNIETQLQQTQKEFDEYKRITEERFDKVANMLKALVPQINN